MSPTDVRECVESRERDRQTDRDRDRDRDRQTQRERNLGAFVFDTLLCMPNVRVDDLVT